MLAKPHESSRLSSELRAPDSDRLACVDSVGTRRRGRSMS